MKFVIKNFTLKNGKQPFGIWLKSLKDTRARIRIEKKIRYIEESGNIGDYKLIGSGVYEFRMHFGPGYRIYFGIEGKQVILLLAGGDKSNQAKDIKKAKDLWISYIESSDYGKT